MLVIKKSEFTFFTVKYSLNTVKRTDQIWNLMNFWQSYRPTLYENTKLTQHDRKFPNITLNLSHHFAPHLTTARSNHCSVLYHHRWTSPVLKLHVNICNLLCVASFTETNFVWDPFMFSLVSLVCFYCWVVLKYMNM